MKIRGERSCRDCGTRWSYYETGSVACPDCESLQSVGVDDRTAHIDSPATLDMSVYHGRIGAADRTLPDDVVAELKRDLRTYVRQRGFIRGGELRPLDETNVAARELLEAVDVYHRRLDPTDADRSYLLALLAGVEHGDRPAGATVPESLRVARGLAAAQAVAAYRSDVLTFLDELDVADATVSVDDSASVNGSQPAERIAPARATLEAIRDSVNRFKALQGDVDPVEADALIAGANAVGKFVRTGESDALETATQSLDRADNAVGGEEL